MGLLSGIAKLAAPIAGNLIAPGIGGAIGGALAGALGGSGASQSGTATSTNQNKLDPRADAMLWGQNGQPGLLGQYQSMLGQQMTPGLQAYSQSQQNYLQGSSPNDTMQMHQAGSNLLGGSAAGVSVPSYAVGNQVQAPSQNNVNLAPAYQSMIYGDTGANPYLNQHLQSAVDLTNAGFQKNQTDLTNNLMRNVLPSIRSNSVLTGQYGGSRQGIAEGNALSDFTNQLTNANTQLGLANSANTTGAQANAFNQGQDRALSAMQGLGAQQYGVAQQNAATKNAAEFMNIGNQFDASKANAGLNLAGQQTGAGMLSGLTNTAYNTAMNQDQYNINNALKVNSLLTPYLGMGQTSTTSQPLYQNQTGNMLGGAMLGGALFNGGGVNTDGPFKGQQQGTLGDLMSGFLKF